jgi:excisionase family DNA binding protein
MKKEEAAAFIGASVRTLQRLTKDGKVAVRYQRGPKGDEAHYEEIDLQQYLESNKPISLIRPGSSPATAAPLVVTGGATDGATGDVTKRMLAAFEAMARTPISDLSAKMMLSRGEAARLSGLPLSMIKEAVASGKLKAMRTGAGWRVKREHVEAYIKKL